MKTNNFIFENQWYYGLIPGVGGGKSMFFNVDVDGGSNQGTSNTAVLNIRYC